MIAEPVGDRLDKAGPLVVAGGFDRVFCRRVHGHDVVAIYLLADEARSDRFLRQRFGCGLEPQRYGNSPLIIGGDEHNRQLVHTCEVHRLPEVALRGGAVAEQTYGNARLLSRLEGVGDARSVGGLRSDRNAKRKILNWPGEAMPRSSPPQNSKISSSLTPRQIKAALSR